MIFMYEYLANFSTLLWPLCAKTVQVNVNGASDPSHIVGRVLYWGV